MTSTLVAWCNVCEHYLPADQIGQSCPTLWGEFGVDHKRKLRKRRGFICERCEEQPIIFDIKEFRRHSDDHDYDPVEEAAQEALND